MPERADAEPDHARMSDEKPAANLLDAAALGATDGLRLALNVGAMLIAFVALLALINWPLNAIGHVPAVHGWLAGRGVEELNLQVVLGWLFAPLAWCMGVPTGDAGFVGRLMGEKLILTEFFAYVSLAHGVNDPGGAVISERASAIAAYALCGFANFGSIGIQIGGLSALAPGRRADFVSLAFKAMIGGAFASWMTAAIAGMFL
ncbi:MAG: nucleoside transporter C-terminal domain-containing protein [Phycisphaerales bacterium]